MYFELRTKTLPKSYCLRFVLRVLQFNQFNGGNQELMSGRDTNGQEQLKLQELLSHTAFFLAVVAVSEAAQGISGQSEGRQRSSSQDTRRTQPHPEGLRQGHQTGQSCMNTSGKISTKGSSVLRIPIQKEISIAQCVASRSSS